MNNREESKFEGYLLLENQQETTENIELFHAATRGSIKDVKKYLQSGAKPNFFFKKEENKNSLHTAAENQRLDVVKLLLENGAVVNSVAITNQTTPLELAATVINPEIITVLIENRANVNHANSYGNTALHEACREAVIENIPVLLQYDADINAQNHKGSTPLHMVCYSNSSDAIEIAKLLISKGANIHEVDKKGMTPLLSCCTSGRIDLVKVLVEMGADPTVKDFEGRNGYEIATFHKQSELAKYFEAESPFGRFAEKK